MQNLDKNILIQNIKSLMDKNNMKQEHLAKAINVGQPSISKCLTGKQSISIDLAFSIAQYFGVTLDDLCKDPSEPGNNTETVNSSNPFDFDFQKVCAGLATVFKYADLRTKEFEIPEVIYEEEVTTEGYETGIFVRKKGILNTDPSVKYNTFYFPNHYEVRTAFPSREAADEYHADLQYLGNANEPNMDINAFFNKLCDLNRIYRNGSITYEAYVHAINSNLQEIVKKKEARD